MFGRSWVRFLSGTQNFSLSHARVMLINSPSQKYNWPQKTCKPLENIFPGSNWSVIVMRIEQSEVYAKV